MTLYYYYTNFRKYSQQLLLQFKEREAIRICLKHFRQRGSKFSGVYEALRASSGLTLEDQRLSALHDTLVLKADYAATEEFMANAVQGRYHKIYCLTLAKILLQMVFWTSTLVARIMLPIGNESCCRRLREMMI